MKIWIFLLLLCPLFAIEIWAIQRNGMTLSPLSISFVVAGGVFVGIGIFKVRKDKKLAEKKKKHAK